MVKSVLFNALTGNNFFYNGVLVIRPGDFSWFSWLIAAVWIQGLQLHVVKLDAGWIIVDFKGSLGELLITDDFKHL